MKRVLQAAGLLVVIAMVAPPAMAEERSYWQGRDLDNDRIFWSCARLEGDDWRVSINGEATTYETVADDGETVELRAKGNKEFKLKISKGTLSINRPDSKFRWISVAKGKWRD